MSDATRNEPSGSAANQAWETLTDDEKNALNCDCVKYDGSHYDLCFVPTVESILAARLAARRVPTVEEITTVLRKMVTEYALDQESIHASWRCQYPDQYGPCRCVDEFVVEYSAVLSGLYGEGNGHV